MVCVPAVGLRSYKPLRTPAVSEKNMCIYHHTHNTPSPSVTHPNTWASLGS